MMRRMIPTSPCPRCDADNPAGARFCSACGAALCRPPAPAAAAALPAAQRFCNGCGRRRHAGPPRTPAARATPGERRHATVMFSDLTGYTALNESPDPEEVEAIMGRIKARGDRA